MVLTVKALAIWLAILGLAVTNGAMREAVEAFTFKDGTLWPVVLLITLAAPYIAARLRRLA